MRLLGLMPHVHRITVAICDRTGEQTHIALTRPDMSQRRELTASDAVLSWPGFPTGVSRVSQDYLVPNRPLP